MPRVFSSWSDSPTPVNRRYNVCHAQVAPDRHAAEAAVGPADFALQPAHRNVKWATWMVTFGGRVVMNEATHQGLLLFR